LDHVPDGLGYREMKEFWVIQELFRQQSEMYQEKKHRIDDRIVSVAQPHVRPIVRGKAAAPVEFGAQVSLSIQNGFSRIHRIEWDAYNEGSDLLGQLEAYKTQHGYYPEIVLADKKYGTKENRAFMKTHGITYGGSPLGRPKKDGTRSDLLPKEIVNERNWIEGKFGLGKRSYGLDCIKARRADTSESWIASIFFMMNLSVLLKILGSSFLSLFYSLIQILLKDRYKEELKTRRRLYAGFCKKSTQQHKSQQRLIQLYYGLIEYLFYHRLLQKKRLTPLELKMQIFF